MQLELTVLTTADVWDHLPEHDNPQIQAGTDEQSLWGVLDALQRSGSGEIRIKNSETREHKVIGYSELMTAYSDFKNRKHG